MSVSLYQTGVSGLLAAQQQLATTGHNIANVNTEGYSRQRAEQNATIGIYSGGNYTGSGTYVEDIRRIYDEFAQKEQMLNQTKLGNADGLNASLDQLNNIVGTLGTSTLNSLDQFYKTMNSIADNPSNLGLRSMAISQAGILSTDFNSLNTQFNQLEKSVNGEIEQIASQVTSIAFELAQINDQILQYKDLSQTGKPNDLLDERDKLVSELSQFTQVSTIEDMNGVMTVIIGNGNTIVTGPTAFALQVAAGDPDPSETTLQLVSNKSSSTLRSSDIGGELGAKLEYRNNHLKDARASVDRLATAISFTLNESQADGLDLNGLQGTDLFTDVNATILQQGRFLGFSDNTGNLQGEITITDLSALSSDEFQIEYDGANYQLTNMNDGVVTNLGAAGSGTYTTAYGFDFVEAVGAPAAGDVFAIRPNENSASLMKVQLSNGTAIAASSAVSITASDNNVSPGSITIIDMQDPILAQTLMPMRLEVLENPTGSGTFTYELFDNTDTSLGVNAYTPPSQQVTVGAAFVIEIAGLPSGLPANAPEEFFFGDAFGLGNGQNAFDMSLTQGIGILNGGQETFSQNLGITQATVGSKAKSAELISETADALYEQSYNRNQETKGVNLDEEAANLMKFQQAYQASSKIISVANIIFDTLLSAAR